MAAVYIKAITPVKGSNSRLEARSLLKALQLPQSPIRGSNRLGTASGWQKT